MKFSECNARQKKAWKNVVHAISWIVGGWENTLMDNPEDSKEYKSAKAMLSDHDKLAEYIYNEVITRVYDEDGVMFGESEERYLKDIRFCGKAWIMERIERRLRKQGY